MWRGLTPLPDALLPHHVQSQALVPLRVSNLILGASELTRVMSMWAYLPLA